MIRFLNCCAALAAIACAMSPLSSHAGEPIVRIEEDWTVEVGTPDPEKHAPQIIVVVSPTADLSSRHGLFELNHRTLPDYSAGGMQLQVWNGQTNLEKQSSPHTNVLSNVDEVVKFTMRMKVDNGLLQFEVVNGTSETWGVFGNQGNLKSTVSTGLTDLSGYRKSTSTTHSQIGFAKHRVKCLKRTAVRYYSASGLVHTDNQISIVHTHASASDDD